MTSYDTIVIGAGQAGPGVAAARVGEGKRVAIIEMARAGGTCLNHGCKPTKTLRASAVVAHTARRAADYGVQTGEVSVDFGTAIGRVRSIIGEMQRSLDEWIASVDGLDYVMGTAQLRTDPDGRQHEVTVNGQVFTAPEIHLNVGARASRPPIDGLDSVPVMTEVELLALNELPEHLLIVGGGYIGCEFGQMFRRFGAEVTMIAGGPLAPQEDDDVRQILADTFAEEGISVIPRNLTGVRPHADGIEAAVDDGTTVVGSHLLLATGRVSNSDLLGDHGVTTDEKGFFVVDGRFATSVPGVWALGDVNRHGAFTHTAYQDAQILLEPPRTVDGRVPTYAMFTDPPLGRVGMNTEQARASGRKVLKAEIGMGSVSRAILESETIGVLRILVDGDTEEILGATILGRSADELIQLIGVAQQAGVRYPTVRDALPIHPTMSEYVPSVLRSLEPL
ncbi:MAG TPA: mercuric reductase [Propionibacteriaceae bacterium]|nr:mercuric reductase [Propionibacteriaceae bacterium]